MPDWILGTPDALLRTVVVGVVAYLALIGTLRLSGKRTLAKPGGAALKIERPPRALRSVF
ncbi:MAG: hypothetical protein H0X20_02145 [Chloroflexi bacterium]|nr:hypothetical protein [Chloroflexota bacterium]